MHLTPSTNWQSFVAKSSDGNYYVLDKGIKRPLTNEIIKNQWITNNPSLSNVSATFLSFIPTGQMIERSVESQNGDRYFIENGSKRKIINSSLLRDYAPYSSVTNELLNAIPAGSNIQ